jgi:hypothetical protein
MFEFHGWAVVRNERDEDDYETALILVVSRLERFVDSLGADAVHFRLRDSNGLFCLGVSGCASGASHGIVDVFRWLAEHAPGSYGLLHVFDSDDRNRDAGAGFRVYRLARSRCDLLPDAFQLEPASAVSNRRVGGARYADSHGDAQPGPGPAQSRLRDAWRSVDAMDRIVRALPLTAIWDRAGTLDAHPIRELAAGHVKSMLQTKPFRFAVASVAEPLRWIEPEECLTFWKTEVLPRLVSASKPNPSSYPGGYCYRASEWAVATGERIVVIEKMV